MRRADEELRSLGTRKLADVLRLGGFTNMEEQHGRFCGGSRTHCTGQCGHAEFVQGYPSSAPDGLAVLDRINRLAATCRDAGKKRWPNIDCGER